MYLGPLSISGPPASPSLGSPDLHLEGFITPRLPSESLIPLPFEDLNPLPLPTESLSDFSYPRLPVLKQILKQGDLLRLLVGPRLIIGTEEPSI